jgi:hypothetical protein
MPLQYYCCIARTLNTLNRSPLHVKSVCLAVSGICVTVYVTIESEQQPPDDDDVEDIDELDDTNDGVNGATAARGGTAAVTVGSSGTNASTNCVRLPPVPEGAAAGVLPRVIKSLVERRGMVKKVYIVLYIHVLLLLLIYTVIACHRSSHGASSSHCVKVVAVA